MLRSHKKPMSDIYTLARSNLSDSRREMGKGYATKVILSPS